MFMRYLYICLCEKGYGKIPLFIELRNLNSFSNKNLFSFIYYSIVSPGAVITEDQFHNGLESGVFSLILDGFDEIDFDLRKEVEKQILELRDKYPNALLIVSSRPDPDNRFETWSQFHIYHVEPMNRHQVIELIGKIDYDPSTKKKFLKAIEDSLYATHRSFLSNPLLCIMMLVTFEQAGHIPDKMHIFYERAFDALFFLHDAAKEGVYRRKSYASMSIDEFRNCLSAFSFASYAKEKFSFTPAELRDFVTQALRIEGKRVGITDFISDLVESVCLLQIEGTDYVFTHRSFQEYFSAFFISRSPKRIDQILDQFCRRREDQVLPMALAMNANLIERDWVIPRLQEFALRAAKLDCEAAPIEYVKTLYGGLALEIYRGRPRSFWYTGTHTLGHVFLAMNNLYESEFRQLVSWTGKQVNQDQPVIMRELTKLAQQGDSRVIVAKNGTIRLKGAEQNFNRLAIVQTDNAWVAKTRIPEFFSRQREVMGKILKKAEERQKKQQNILDAMFPEPKKPRKSRFDA